MGGVVVGVVGEAMTIDTTIPACPLHTIVS